MSASRQRVAIVGAGWAGLAAATELRRAGHEVTVFESSGQPGGRARRVDVSDGTRFGAPLDNGQHLLLGAYSATLQLMRDLGVSPERTLLRLPLRLASADGSFDMRAPDLPAPLHALAGLLRARGLGWSDRMAAIRLMLSLRRRRYRVAAGMSVENLLAQTGQTPATIRLLWEPLCLAALNTPIERACAQLFVVVLRDGLDGTRNDSDLLIPRVDLSALWPLAAAERCAMRYRRPVRALQPADDGVAVDGEAFDRAIVAVPPHAVQRLLPQDAAAQALLHQLGAFDHEPIATLTLRLDGPYRLPLPIMMLMQQAEHGHDGQWVFDRGMLLGLDEAHGELTVVISAAVAAVDRSREATTAGLIRQLASQLAEHPGGLAPLPAVLASELIVEKRATFAAVPGLARPGNATPWPRIWLAGDWTDTGYPGTLEGAVRSGQRAAREMMATLVVAE